MSEVKQHSIDLNCDMGELHPETGLNYDKQIMPYISSCNICCGYHSGSLELSAQTIKIANDFDVAIGAHPSYNDKKNFGRVTPNVDIDTLKNEIREQVLSIKHKVENSGRQLNHVKPHGALYNDLAKDEQLSFSFIDIIKEIDPNLKIYGLANSIFEKACISENMKFVKEVFADRRYESKNQLRSRQKDGALLHHKTDVLKQITELTSGTIIDFHGRAHKVEAQSICLHSDTLGAVKLAKDIHEHLKSKGIAILQTG